MKLILVTGMSGAGKTVALKTLEDCGFEAIDNLPLGFLPAVIASPEPARNLAIACDIRSRDFSAFHLLEMIASLRKNEKIQIQFIFLDCDDEVLRRRFTETRRKHPLAEDRAVIDGIALERELLSDLRSKAEIVIDTSDYKPGELRQVVAAHIAQSHRRLSLAISSFSYKHGLPRDADLVFDVRFLKNPYYEEQLRPLSGKDKQVGAYIETDKDFMPFFEKLIGLIRPLLPRYLAEGKSYLTIAIGCTGGQHRSVHVVEKLAGALTSHGYDITIRHRDITL